MLRATEINTTNTVDIHSPREVNELLANNPDTLFTWAPVMPAKSDPLEQPDTDRVCSDDGLTPMFERLSVGDYCARCHWTSKLHAGWENWQPK